MARLPFPEEWRLVLILDTSMEGVHGSREVEAFRELPPFPEAHAAEICRIVLMQVLPACVTGDVAAFGAGITRMQDLVGDHFAPHQGGRYASPSVAAALAEAARRRVPGYGQSSWGPTGFVLAPSEAEARSLVEALDRGRPAALRDRPRAQRRRNHLRGLRRLTRSAPLDRGAGDDVLNATAAPAGPDA